MVFYLLFKQVQRPLCFGIVSGSRGGSVATAVASGVGAGVVVGGGGVD